jgi:hypothetical protein
MGPLLGVWQKTGREGFRKKRKSPGRRRPRHAADDGIVIGSPCGLRRAQALRTLTHWPAARRGRRCLPMASRSPRPPPPPHPACEPPQETRPGQPDPTVSCPPSFRLSLQSAGYPVSHRAVVHFLLLSCQSVPSTISTNVEIAGNGSITCYVKNILCQRHT